MNKKEAKIHYMRKQLEDPNISEFEKQEIRKRLGVAPIYSENDFISKHGYELLNFVSNYFEDQLAVIRRKKRTNSPLSFFTDNLKIIYHLSSYDCLFEEDTLEQLYDNGFEDVKELIKGFQTINRLSDAKLLESILNKRITDKKIEHLLDHFRENEKNVQEIETEVEKLIQANIKEILELQNLQ